MHASGAKADVMAPGLPGPPGSGRNVRFWRKADIIAARCKNRPAMFGAMTELT